MRPTHRRATDLGITFDTFREIIDRTLREHPDLVPFNDGDRAEQLGRESATAFAQRKLIACSPGSPGHRARGPAGPRGIALNR